MVWISNQNIDTNELGVRTGTNLYELGIHVLSHVLEHRAHMADHAKFFEFFAPIKLTWRTIQMRKDEIFFKSPIMH